MLTASAVISGILTVGRGTTSTCSEESYGSDDFTLRLRTTGFLSGGVLASKATTIASPGAYVALAWQTGLKARLFYLRALEGYPTSVQFTFASTGVVSVPITGTILIEAAEGDEITAAGVKGSAVFEWCAVGGAT